MGFRDPALSLIEGKLAGRTRLSREDGLALFASPDILGVGRLADRVRRARHGNRAYYIVNRQINQRDSIVSAVPEHHRAAWMGGGRADAAG